MLKRDKDLKLYYSISEVAKMFDVSETALRYWEKEFPKDITPKKAARGIRQYSKENLEQVRVVVHLIKEKGMTLQGARETLRRDKEGTGKRVEVIDRLIHIREELQELNRNLNGLV